MENRIRQAKVTEPGALTVRLERLGLPILIGFFLTIYIGFGVVYFQQNQNIPKLKSQLALREQQLQRPPPVTEQLKGYHETVNKSIPTGLKGEDTIVAIVNLADKSGFDVTLNTTKLSIPQGDKAKTEKVGKRSYSVLSIQINGIHGDYGHVMAFISNLYSEPGLETLVINKVAVDRDDDTAGNATASIECQIFTLPEKGGK